MTDIASSIKTLAWCLFWGMVVSSCQIEQGLRSANNQPPREIELPAFDFSPGQILPGTTPAINSGKE